MVASLRHEILWTFWKRGGSGHDVVVRLRVVCGRFNYIIETFFFYSLSLYLPFPATLIVRKSITKASGVPKHGTPLQTQYGRKVKLTGHPARGYVPWHMPSTGLGLPWDN